MRYTYTKSLLVILCIAAVAFYSCRPSKKSSYKAGKNNTDTEMGEQINFVLLKISTDTVKGKNRVELLGQTQGAGQMKKDAGLHSNPQNYLVIDVTEGNDIKYSITIEHPLYKNIEYTTESDELATKNVELKSAEFYIRFQYFKGNAKLRISEKRVNKELTELNTIKL